MKNACIGNNSSCIFQSLHILKLPVLHGPDFHLPCDSLNCVIDRKNVNSLSIFYIWASLNAERTRMNFYKSRYDSSFFSKLKHNQVEPTKKLTDHRTIISESFNTHLTISPRRTLRLFRTHLLILILSSVTVSSDRTMQTVSRLLLPFRRTVSPLNNWSSSILVWRD